MWSFLSGLMGVWRGDSRACEQGQIIYPGSNGTKQVNLNTLNLKPASKIEQTTFNSHHKTSNNSNNQQPITMTDTNDKPISSPVSIPVSTDPNPANDNQEISNSNKNSLDNQPIRLNVANSNPIRLSASSSSDSSDSSKTTTWGQVKKSSPKKNKKDSKKSSENSKSPNTSPTKNRNDKNLTSWKNVSPSKSTSGSDLEQSNHSSGSNDCTHRIFRFSTSRLKDSNDSTELSSDPDPEVKVQAETNEYANKVLPQSEQGHEYSNSNKDKVQRANHNEDKTCNKCSNKSGSPCKKAGGCNCSNNCQSHLPDNQNALVNSSTSLNDNGSPKKEKSGNSPDDVCDNEYFYEDDFSVQFDTNLRETSVTPIDSDPNTTILDFPNMVTGSYLRFNGGSSNVSFNNSKASSNVSLNTLRVSNIINNEADHRIQYDSENSGNSGSRNSTMEMSSSDTGRDMMGSSDIIELSDGPLFTPTPSNIILSTDSLDRQGRDNGDGEMSGSNGSGSDTNLHVDCCPRKEEYFLSFDGSHSKVSGSETDISLSFTSHDSCPGHWVQSETSGMSHEGQPCCHSNCCQGQEGHDASNEFSSSEGQEESSDSFHICFNKLSPRHKGSQYQGRENLTSRVLKRLVTVKETSPEHGGDTDDDEQTHTSTTLTAGSKDVSSLSPHTSTLKRQLKPVSEQVKKLKGKNSKGEQLYLVGIGKPVDIMRKASVHSHTLPRVKKLVSWKQVKNFRNGNSSKCQSLPDISSSTSWQNISAMKCRKLSEVSESFHNKRHSASLFEFYQRMKSESNPVSPETMNNLEQILWPNFIGQKLRSAELSDSSGSSQDCLHCQCKLPDSASKGYTNKRIFDWLKMDCSSSSRDSTRPNSLACQTGLAPESVAKETLISPQTVTLWCGTKTVGSQFPPATKDCSMQTLVDSLTAKDSNKFGCCTKKDQALQTSDFEEEEILSILSDNFDEYNFLKSNEGIAKDLISCPDFKLEMKETGKIQRSKSAEGYRSKIDRNYNPTNKSYQEGTRFVGRSKSTGRLGDKSGLLGRRMGVSRHYSHQSLPDIGFLSASASLEKTESKDSLFDAMKLDLPNPVTIAPKTELEKFNIYKQKSTPCPHHRPRCGNRLGSKSEADIGSSSSGISTSSASSGIDPGYCDCRSRASESPENDLERLIFFPPHTEEKIKSAKDCCNAKRRAKSLPSRLSECARSGSDPKLNKYANEVRPLTSGTKGQGQCRISQKWITGLKHQEVEGGAENLYALEEEATPVASPDQPGFYGNNCYETGCQDNECHHDNKTRCNYFSGEQNFTESDFYRAVESDKIIVVGNEYYQGYAIGLDSTSSSGSSVPHMDRKPLKSCLRKRNRSLRSTRSMSAADTMALNFDDLEAKVKNHRHSYGCDEVYIVSDEHGQLMMYQADDSAEPVMFYLGKDGECHMTEGNRNHLQNHLQNFGSLANFNIQATDSIHEESDGSSTDREGSNSSKRKSVSFASEVSFQSISPAMSPKKQSHVTGSENQNEASGDQNEATEDKQEVPQNSGNEKGDQSKAEVTNNPAPTSTDQSDCSVQSCDPVLPSNSSSSDSAPDVFHVAMDTNDNLWFEDVMLEKIGLLESVSKASDVLVAHFATSADTFEKLRLGNTTETPVLGDIVITRLCTALTAVLGDGLKHHLAGFQMFGSVQVTVWKVVEASVEIVPQTRSLCDLVQKVKQTTYLTTHQQKFDAFVFGLLNLRVLDFWMGYLRQKESQLSKFYNTGAILVHSNTALKKHYDDVITSIQGLAVLPFHLDMAFIREKALTDSKFKSQEMIGSAEGMVVAGANQKAELLDSPVNEVAAKARSSVLDFSASKALNWLANAALSKRQSFTDAELLTSKSKSQTSESTNENPKKSTSANDMPEAATPEFEPVEGKCSLGNLSEDRRKTYKDAKISSVDCDPIISPSESLRSSQTSQTGFSSLFTTMAAKFGDNPLNTSLTQSMTSSASSLVSRLTGLKLGASQKPYKKEATEYNFEKVESEPVCENENAPKEQNGDKVKMRVKKTETNPADRDAKRVSFDIVNLFDKLLLPPTKPEKSEPKPTSKIPVPKSRWSWNFSMPKVSSAASQPKTAMPKASTDSEIMKNKTCSPARTQSRRTTGSVYSSTNKNEHFPKRSNAKSGGDSSKGGNTVSRKTSSHRVAAPPKPPRLVQSTPTSGKTRGTSQEESSKKNTATL